MIKLMNLLIIVAIVSQLLFTLGDLLARTNMPKFGFNTSAFLSSWFLIYFTLRTFAMFGQLYILSSVDLGKTAALFGAISIILANVLGLLLLKEILSLSSYLGITLAIFAFLVLSLSR